MSAKTIGFIGVGMMGGPKAFPLLIQALEDPQETVRAYAAGNLIGLMK